jgi:hypothetical protein
MKQPASGGPHHFSYNSQITLGQYLGGLFPARHNKTDPINKICYVQLLLWRTFICRTRTIGFEKFEPICAMYFLES